MPQARAMYFPRALPFQICDRQASALSLVAAVASFTGYVVIYLVVYGLNRCQLWTICWMSNEIILLFGNLGLPKTSNSDVCAVIVLLYYTGVVSSNFFHVGE